MKKSLFLFLLGILLTGCINKQKNNIIATTQPQKKLSTSQVEIKQKNYDAWNGTKWGMSKDEIKTLFPLATEKDYDLYCPEGYERVQCSSYILEKYKIGNYVYDVDFGFLKEKLSTIRIDCKPNNRESRENEYDLVFEVSLCAREMSFLLEEKYGNDFAEEIKNKEWQGGEFGINSNSQTTKKIWQTENNTIKYSYYDCTGECGYNKGLTYRNLIIDYLPNPEKFKVDSDLYNSAQEKI